MNVKSITSKSLIVLASLITLISCGSGGGAESGAGDTSNSSGNVTTQGGGETNVTATGGNVDVDVFVGEESNTEELAAITSTIGIGREQVNGFVDGFEAEFMDRDSEDFSGVSNSILDVKTLYRWVVEAGSVDLISHNDSFEIICPSGSVCIDLDGHDNVGTIPSSRLRSRGITINVAGTYRLRLLLGGGGRILKPRKVAIEIESYLERDEITIEPGDQIKEVVREFTVSNAGGEAVILIETIGEGDNNGPLLDDVSIIEGGFRR